MRRFSLGCVVLVAAMIALPASGREFRTDAVPCDSPSTFTECWGQPPSGEMPVLPIGVINGVLGTNVFVDSASFPRVNFSTANFFLTAFDYQLFYEVNVNPAAIVTPPLPNIVFGLHRPDPGPNPVGWTGNETPLLRIDWEFDPVFLNGLHSDVFLPFGFDKNRIGVQLLFGLNDPDGFQLNGLQLTPEGYAYSYSRTAAVNGDFIWGRADPCDTFNNAGLCSSSVPEPSSYALLAIGLLAVTFGVRARKPARIRPA